MTDESERLIGELSKRGLGRVAEAIAAQAMPAIGVSAYAVDERRLTIGASKIGGLPDLPEGVAWPEVRGYPLSFVAQVNLADVGLYDEEQILPVQGLLSFFFGSNRDLELDADEDDQYDYMTFYCGSDHHNLNLRRQEPAANLLLGSPSNASYGRIYRACQMGFWRKLTLPDVDTVNIESLELTIPERNAYIDMYLERTDDLVRQPRSRSHQILGYPRQLEFNPLISCYLASTNRSVVDWTSGTPAEQAEIEHEVRNWRLLLQLDSDEQARMNWETMGMVYFGMTDEDLRIQRFDRIQAVMHFV